MRQFIRCRFREGDTRTYTYHNDGEPVAVGDFVKVPDNRADGWKRVEVVDIDAQEPTGFATKGILGKADDSAAEAA